jgi:4-hydroxy-3-polyprenylbenzoate decarboxylase
VGPIVLGISGASGMPIALTTLSALREAGKTVDVVLSDGAVGVLREECGVGPDAVAALARHVYRDSDLAAAVASGSTPTEGMAVVPCSATSVARIALGLGDTLVARAAHVHLKEHRKLILVPRETPLSPILLTHLTRLAELGVVILPPTPAYYLHPTSVEEVTRYVAGKVLDHLGVPHALYRGWRAEEG